MGRLTRHLHRRIVLLPAVVGSAADAQPQQSARERLTEFYRLHNQAKLKDVDKLLKKFYGRENELFDRLEKKYGVEVKMLEREAPTSKPGEPAEL